MKIRSMVWMMRPDVQSFVACAHELAQAKISCPEEQDYLHED